MLATVVFAAALTRPAVPSRARAPRMQTFEAPVAYWWFITVPEARLNLAKDKRLEGGDTKQYLEALRDSPDERPLERWFFDKWLRQLRPSKAPRPAPEASAEDASAPAPAPT